MANGGIKFRQWISGSCICTPSRASLLTGRYASRSGMESDDKNFRTFNSAAQPGGLPLEELSIASVLKQANYSTALIGKWHLGVNDESNSDGKFLPASHGFDLFYGYINFYFLFVFQITFFFFITECLSQMFKVAERKKYFINQIHSFSF